MAANIKQTLTKTLLSFELQKDSGGPAQLARQIRDFLEQLKTAPKWDDSRSATTASFLNLIQDTTENQEYLAYNDLKSRATELLIFVSHKLSPAEAQTLSLQSYQRMSTSPEALATAQRLSRPGGVLLETARELPDPLVDEAKRRGGQARLVASSAAEELRPTTTSFKRRFDEEGWTKPLILLTLASILIFVKNKMLALTIDGILIYLVIANDIARISLPGRS
jgi:hypothetical protein